MRVPNITYNGAIPAGGAGVHWVPMSNTGFNSTLPPRYANTATEYPGSANLWANPAPAASAWPTNAAPAAAMPQNWAQPAYPAANYMQQPGMPMYGPPPLSPAAMNIPRPIRAVIQGLAIGIKPGLILGAGSAIFLGQGNFMSRFKYFGKIFALCEATCIVGSFFITYQDKIAGLLSRFHKKKS